MEIENWNYSEQIPDDRRGYLENPPSFEEITESIKHEMVILWYPPSSRLPRLRNSAAASSFI